MEHIETGWLNTRAAARRLGVTFRQLYRLIGEHQLRVHRVDDDVQLRESDVSAYRRRRRAT